jgi:alkylhydroperoxidase family enzyme
VDVPDPDGWDLVTHPADALLNRFTGAVGAMRGLDPLTTEVIRLRGAAQHNCRLCRSLRESAALEAGGSESLYGDIEAYQASQRLTEAHKAALGYVDALIWTPAAVDEAAAVVLETLLDRAGGGDHAGRDAQRHQQDRGRSWAGMRRG